MKKFIIWSIIIILIVSSIFLAKNIFKKVEKFNNINSKDLVSVIIPTYNRFDVLLETIKSVQNQTYQNIEIIVINDCSTDTKYKSGVLENLNKVKIIHLPINLRKKYNVKAAQGKTRDEGIKISKGKWIAFLDDDDYWYPTKLERQMEVLKENPGIFMSSTNMYMGYGMYDKNKKYTDIMLKENIPTIIKLETIKNGNKILNSTVILHRNIINKVGEFDLGKNEDWEYWKKAMKYTDCYFINEPLVYYDDNHAGQKNYEYYN
jgi:glycosyltransferase involved in cell wall biosynthesis